MILRRTAFIFIQSSLALIDQQSVKPIGSKAVDQQFAVTLYFGTQLLRMGQAVLGHARFLACLPCHRGSRNFGAL